MAGSGMGVWSPGAILTASGRMIDPLNVDPALLVIEDIAHALANLCRFGGHSRRFYSVAEHCCLGLQFVPDEHKLRWLLHDAAEAYLGDVVRPLKHSSLMRGYKAQEECLHAVIARKFGVPITWAWGRADAAAWMLRETDERMLATEMRDLMPSRPDYGGQAKPFPILISPVSHEDWRTRFLEEFYFWQEQAQHVAAAAATKTAGAR
jgi:hypothetical protein